MTQSKEAVVKPSKIKAKKRISFSAELHRPVTCTKAQDWTFVKLPGEASKKLHSRGLVAVEGLFNGVVFTATLQPDGNGGHWLKVEDSLRTEANVQADDVVTLEISPLAEEPEPSVPDDLRKALSAAHPKTRETWSAITPAARRDWIHWIESAKREETRVKRIENGCDRLEKGKRRPCCFDRSGMYSKSLSCPKADEPTKE